MPTKRPLPHRIAGDLALDLANTVSWRGTEREVDHLADVDAILAWAQAAGLIDASFRVSRQRREGLIDDVHRLRAAINAAGAAVAHGRSPPDAALACIRDLAARSLAGASLTGAPAKFSFAPADRIVGPVAWAALDLFLNGELDRLKQCPPAECRWLFIDETKNRSRRWCDMGTCGNRAKVRRSRVMKWK
jgi:predicted RNA-binding Zn ribbon-like protein